MSSEPHVEAEFVFELVWLMGGLAAFGKQVEEEGQAEATKPETVRLGDNEDVNVVIGSRIAAGDRAGDGHQLNPG